ncbi:MAG: ABC transporter permease [Planctomycetia bacterium]|nr:ABC transporter permease [Planctomycetia bacterium]
MYKFLLCWRYLRTRYIALASIVSVTLGVATMIVVNSVMSGFTTEMRNRLHGILSDVVLESRSLNGFRDAERHMELIRKVAGDAIEGMTPTVAVPAMLSFTYRGEKITRPVQLIGIDGRTQCQVSDFGKYLQHPANRESIDFQLRDGGYDTRDRQSGPDAPERPQMADAGWKWRRMVAEEESLRQRLNPPAPKPAPQPDAGGAPELFAPPPEEKVFDPAKDQHRGVVLGIALTCYRDHEGDDHFYVLPGDDVQLLFPNAASKTEGILSFFTVVDLYESKMSEYDSQFVFVPIEALQKDRGMFDPTTGVGMVNQIQIKLKPGADGVAVRDKLRKAFPAALYSVSTWKDKQGPLLAAVQMETAILNVLLFLIIAVAGFGILAIFLMIVIDKTRDIGILKSLGASRGGIMGIFLGYGLSLGLVGSGAGLVLGLLFVGNINAIAGLLGEITGQPVFDPAIYYFYKIPTLVDPWTIGWIVSGALGIAVLASVLPALRAALLHPVEALRYE